MDSTRVRRLRIERFGPGGAVWRSERMPSRPPEAIPIGPADVVVRGLVRSDAGPGRKFLIHFDDTASI
ncbi:hypothetical protein ACIGEP_09815 [Microbacterium sp. NPDC077663]|uniref:hypothetical protein n=1 Tax=Microbacterium sp. NPDC077663 TaxID=3364189 RepID=UPI0037C8EC36